MRHNVIFKRYFIPAKLDLAQTDRFEPGRNFEPEILWLKAGMSGSSVCLYRGSLKPSARKNFKINVTADPLTLDE